MSCHIRLRICFRFYSRRFSTLITFLCEALIYFYSLLKSAAWQSCCPEIVSGHLNNLNICNAFPLCLSLFFFCTNCKCACVCVCINAYVCAFIIHKIITLSQAGACCFSRLEKGGGGHCKKQRWHLLLVLIWNVCINHKMSPAINGASF